MKEFIEFIAKNLVNNPEDVRVEESEENGTVKLRLFVKEEETGKVIGKEGKTAKAMRTLLTAIASKNQKRVILEIPDITRENS